MKIAATNLNDFNNGALAEKFAIEMDKVISNLLDPNTKLTDKRKITMEVTLDIKEGNREEPEITTKVISKLAPSQAIKSKLNIARRNGKNIWAEYGNPANLCGQLKLTDDGEIVEDGGLEDDILQLIQVSQ